MKTLNQLIDKAKLYKNELPLVTIDELRSKIETSTVNSDSELSFYQKRRKTIMICISVIVLSVLGSLIMNQSGGDYSRPVEIKSMRTTSDVRYNQEARRSDDNILKPVPAKGKTASKEQKQKSEFSALFNRTSETTIKGLNIINLTEDELRNIVPDIELGDTSFTLIEERYVSNPMYFQMSKMDSLGYDITKLPHILYESTTYDRILHTTFGEIPFNGTTVSGYNRTLYVGYSIVTDEDKIGTTNINCFSPIFYFSDDAYLKEYGKFVKGKYDFLMTLPKDRNDFVPKMSGEKQQSLKPVMDSLWALSREFESNVISRLIPVKVSLKNLDEYLLLWFVPNEEFLNRLPLRYMARVKNEIEIMKKLNSDLITFNDACRGLSEQESLFDLCRTKSGAIENAAIISNSQNSSPSLKVKLTDSRNLLISVHTIDGLLIRKIAQSKYESGENLINLNLENNNSKLLLISIQSDQGEHVVVKYFRVAGE